LTAHSIAAAIRNFVLPKIGPAGSDMILSGGGAKNTTLVNLLSRSLSSLGVRVGFSDEYGIPAQAKEAVAFAVLAYETWHRRPSNIPSATSAKRPAILGKITHA
jgi:anhydro-N-acetylmuramic acid kinase